MVSLVLDCSAALSWIFDDERNAAAIALQERVLRHGALVPALWRTEVSNALLVAERRKRIPVGAARLARAKLSKHLIEDAPSPDWATMDRIHLLAEAHKLTIYDAVYLELTVRRSLPLATTDGDLIRAGAAVGLPAL